MTGDVVRSARLLSNFFAVLCCVCVGGGVACACVRKGEDRFEGCRNNYISSCCYSFFKNRVPSLKEFCLLEQGRES